MIMNRNIIILVLFNFLVISESLYGCECTYNAEINHYKLYSYEIVQLVEINDVVQINDSLNKIITSILETFYNPRNDSIFMFLNYNNIICSPLFKKGERWLIYGNYNEKLNQYIIEYCSHSKKILPNNKKLNGELYFLKNYKTINDSSVCPNISYLDTPPEFDVLYSELKKIVIKHKITKPLYIEIIITKEGYIKFSREYSKTNDIVKQNDIKEIIIDIESIKGVIPGLIKKHKVNVAYTIIIGGNISK